MELMHRRVHSCEHILAVVDICGYGITVVHQPSKLVIGVRLPLPAPKKSRWSSRAAKGGRL